MAVFARLIPLLAIGLILFGAWQLWKALFTKDLTPLQRARVTFAVIVGIALAAALLLMAAGG
jgi:hypothetical protein